ncbi:DeoR/GlpR family DNA-binding transcription regulator [Glutamicibacter sp. MNS18]|uniref:DeoR/GlpR family DNA-binding transcription regulator n=1 Tax=Glutamicibacter sp. MNS18 TaxID=2989817 RepID=UPI0022361456|nr:DeoR/GlpR family DNA-binding transcription regulator [Glutamicibacter sp. MNS18]MCW4465402.1 DeoR/GlpR family DNA-binding transcription regulator [Glutamicibacter sp. MNS18]
MEETLTRTTSLIPEQRRQKIIEHLRTAEVLSYRQITELLGISQMTARRDVATLAKEGRVEATQGGAVAVPTARLLAEPHRSVKEVADLPSKAAIAREAAKLVGDSMTIYLDAGTTVQAIRPYLQERQDLTVVSNDLATIAAFLDHPSVDLICVGGRVDRDNQSTIGRLASLTLAELSLDIAFLSSSSWDVQRGITTPVEAKIDPKRAAMASASQSVLLTDSGKFGRYAKYRVAPLDGLTTIISDSGLGDEAASQVGALGINLIRAEFGDEESAE